MANINENKEAYQMMKNALGSIENRFREAYNKGYKDGLRDGASQVTAKLVSKILEETEADTPQTGCDKCIWSVCNYNEVDWDADTPQHEQMKTADYCDICKQDMCKDCIADATNPYCVPSHYEINYEPKDEPKTQMKTQNSNLTFEKRTMLDCYNCKWYKSDDACVECRYEPKADTPQTEQTCETCEHYGVVSVECDRCDKNTHSRYEPQTERKE